MSSHNKYLKGKAEIGRLKKILMMKERELKTTKGSLNKVQ